MIIYRFERDGIGPFMTSDGAIGRIRTPRAWKKSQRILNGAWKSFNKSEEAHRRKDFLFGCSDKKYLRAYFGYNFKPLFKAGYRIKKYVVPDEEVIDMGCEVAFPVKYHKLRTNKRLRKAVDKNACVF